MNDSQTLNRQIPIIINFDVEPDEFAIDRNQLRSWQGLEQAISPINLLRERIHHVTGRQPHFNWTIRADKQIQLTYGAADWAFENYGAEFENLRSHGDELGVHTHLFRMDKKLDEWVQDYTNLDHIRECVEMGVTAFRQHFGAPRTHSVGGMNWMTNQMRDILAEHGIRYDLTLTPNLKKHVPNVTKMLGSPIDGRQLPRHPYRSSKENFRIADPHHGVAPWFIPVSVKDPQFTVRQFLRSLRNTVLRRTISNNPRFLFRRGPEDFMRSFDSQLKQQPQWYLMVVMRTSLMADPKSAERVLQSFNAILDHPESHRFRFSTPAEALSILGLESEIPIEEPSSQVLMQSAQATKV